MIRLIKRYESRKLYDTEESRYVSLEEIAHWVRSGQEVKVIDNASSADVTSQTLTQIILEQGKRGTSFLPSELLHDLIRVGEKAVSSGMEQVQQGVDRLVQASVDRLAPVRRAREEMLRLRTQLEQLEASLVHLSADVEEATGDNEDSKATRGTRRKSQTSSGAAAKKPGRTSRSEKS